MNPLVGSSDQVPNRGSPQPVVGGFQLPSGRRGNLPPRAQSYAYGTGPSQPQPLQPDPRSPRTLQGLQGPPLVPLNPGLRGSNPNLRGSAPILPNTLPNRGGYTLPQFRASHGPILSQSHPLVPTRNLNPPGTVTSTQPNMPPAQPAGPPTQPNIFQTQPMPNFRGGNNLPPQGTGSPRQQRGGAFIPTRGNFPPPSVGQPGGQNFAPMSPPQQPMLPMRGGPVSPLSNPIQTGYQAHYSGFAQRYDEGQNTEEYGEEEYDEEETTFECGYYADDGTFVEYECDGEGYWDEEHVYHLFDSDTIIVNDLDQLEETYGETKQRTNSGPNSASPDSQSPTSTNGGEAKHRSLSDGTPSDTPPKPSRPSTSLSAAISTNRPQKLDLNELVGGSVVSDDLFKPAFTVKQNSAVPIKPIAMKMVPPSVIPKGVPFNPTRHSLALTLTNLEPRQRPMAASRIVTEIARIQQCSPAEATNLGRQLQSAGYLVPATKGPVGNTFFDSDDLYSIIIPKHFALEAESLKWAGDVPNDGTATNTFAGRTTEQEEKLKFEREREERMIDDVLKRDWDINIWDEQGELNFGRTDAGEDFIESGSLNGLIQHLTFGADIKFLKIFIITYKSFATPSVVLKKLKQRFFVPEKEEEKRKVVQVSVVNFIFQWLELAATDWDSNLVRDLEELTNELTARGSPLAKKITKAVEAMIAGKESLKLQQARIMAQAPPLKLPKSALPADAVGLVIQVPALEIARQLTLLDWSCFSLIKGVEFLDVAWTTPKLKYRAENVLEMIHGFNLRSNWAARIILLQKDFKVRVRCYSALLEIAKELLNLNNFSSCLAIMSGLGNAACYRLKHTKAALKKELQALEAELSNLIDPAFSHKKYRESLGSIVPPAIPHLGVFLGDLVFVEEGNPNVLHTNLINFRKRQLTFGIIRLIQGYQLQGYALRPVTAIQKVLVSSMKNPVDDKVLFDQSLDVEPRDFVPPKLK